MDQLDALSRELAQVFTGEKRHFIYHIYTRQDIAEVPHNTRVVVEVRLEQAIPTDHPLIKEWQLDFAPTD